jgi:hypothetical protein
LTRNAPRVAARHARNPYSLLNWILSSWRPRGTFSRPFFVVASWAQCDDFSTADCREPQSSGTFSAGRRSSGHSGCRSCPGHPGWRSLAQFGAGAAQARGCVHGERGVALIGVTDGADVACDGGAVEQIVHRGPRLAGCRSCSTPTLLARCPFGDGRTTGRHTYFVPGAACRVRSAR